MSESFLLVAMSLGEAQHTLECLAELENTGDGVPERPVSLIGTAMEDGPQLSFEQLERVLVFADEITGTVRG